MGEWAWLPADTTQVLSAAELAELTALGYTVTARAIMAGSTLDDIGKDVWVSE